MKRFILITLLGIATSVAYGQEAYVELLRSDVKADKVAIITEVMQLSDDEGPVFWRTYREYEFEFSKLGDERLALIKDFAAHFESMTDEKARELAEQSFKLEGKRTKLKKKYFKQLAKALSPITAAKFFQLENQLNMLIDLQVASALPLIQ